MNRDQLTEFLLSLKGKTIDDIKVGEPNLEGDQYFEGLFLVIDDKVVQFEGLTTDYGENAALWIEVEDLHKI
jgi:hypothetical protein